MSAGWSATGHSTRSRDTSCVTTAHRFEPTRMAVLHSYTGTHTHTHYAATNASLFFSTPGAHTLYKRTNNAKHADFTHCWTTFSLFRIACLLAVLLLLLLRLLLVLFFLPTHSWHWLHMSVTHEEEHAITRTHTHTRRHTSTHTRRPTDVLCAALHTHTLENKNYIIISFFFVVML